MDGLARLAGGRGGHGRGPGRPRGPRGRLERGLRGARTASASRAQERGCAPAGRAGSGPSGLRRPSSRRASAANSVCPVSRARSDDGVEGASDASSSSAASWRARRASVSAPERSPSSRSVRARARWSTGRGAPRGGAPACPRLGGGGSSGAASGGTRRLGEAVGDRRRGSRRGAKARLTGARLRARWTAARGLEPPGAAARGRAGERRTRGDFTGGEDEGARAADRICPSCAAPCRAGAHLRCPCQDRPAPSGAAGACDGCLPCRRAVWPADARRREGKKRGRGRR